jgi:hypothetical protein
MERLSGCRGGRVSPSLPPHVGPACIRPVPGYPYLSRRPCESLCWRISRNTSAASAAPASPTLTPSGSATNEFAGGGCSLSTLPTIWVTSSRSELLAIAADIALIGASAASQTGNWLYNAALLGCVYSAAHSAIWVGDATICKGLPYVLLGPSRGDHRRPLSTTHRIAGWWRPADADHGGHRCDGRQRRSGGPGHRVHRPGVGRWVAPAWVTLRRTARPSRSPRC